MQYSQKHLAKPIGSAEMDNIVVVVDPSGELVKNLFGVYQKPIKLSWDGVKFGIPNVKDGFFITHVDVTEIILGYKCLNISILYLGMIAMKTLTTTLDGKPDQVVPRWIEPKTNVAMYVAELWLQTNVAMHCSYGAQPVDEKTILDGTEQIFGMSIYRVDGLKEHLARASYVLLHNTNAIAMRPCYSTRQLAKTKEVKLRKHEDIELLGENKVYS
ncbi:hypothetical protein JHK86_004380 [Glycine max]|nr:hypothetical protein JHK86_004380 [Glycine max]